MADRTSRISASRYSSRSFRLHALEKYVAVLFVVLLTSDAHQALANVPDVVPASRPSFQDIETGLRFFEKVKVSTRAAVEAAERELQGATVVDIGFDVQDGVPLYRAKIEIGGKIADVTIDADSKAVVMKPAAADTTAEDMTKVADFKRLGLPLSEVVSVGETYGEGRAVSASIDYADGKLIFLLVVLSRGYLKQVSIDPTGEVERRKRGHTGASSPHAWILREVLRPSRAIR